MILLVNILTHTIVFRYRRDASSLWNWVSELESFQPPNTSRSVNHSEKTPRKSFSRKYLDLRLHPSSIERSSSPECNLKSQKQEKKPQSFNSNKSKKNKKTEILKKDTDNNSEHNDNTIQYTRLLNKTKSKRNKNYKENVLPGNNKDNKISSNEIQAKSELNSSHLKPQAKLNTLQSKKKPEGTKISKQDNSSDQFRREKISSNKETILIENDNLHKYKVLDKIKGLKNVNFNKKKSYSSDQFTESLKKALSNENLLANDQASMVKTLTSYWNNLLNDDIDDTEVSSSHGSSDVSHINKSLQNLARNIYHNAKGSHRRKSLSHRKSESSIDTLTKFDGFTNGSDVFKNQNESKDQIFERLNEILSNGHKNDRVHLEEELLGDNKVERTDSYFIDITYDKSCGDNQNLNGMNNESKVQGGFDPNCDLKTQHAIEVMEKLVRKLKRFSELSLTSDQINLSHSLRAMLCLMTATVLSSEEHVFDDNVRPEVETGITGDEDVAGKFDLRFSSGYSSDSGPPTKRLDYIENSNTYTRNDNLQLVLVQGITMRKVEDALRYLTICKDYLWTEFLLSPRFVEEVLYNQDSDKHSSPYFTFVIEEELLFEDDCDEDKFCLTEDEEDEGNLGVVCKSIFDSISINLERLSELAADIIIHLWPDSFKEFVKTIYQTLVSLLVWWIITKEIFCK